jgi:hypothetical protein
MKTNDFIQKVSAVKPISDMMKIYKSISIKHFSKDDTLCHYGDEGDIFFFIL